MSGSGAKERFGMSPGFRRVLLLSLLLKAALAILFSQIEPRYDEIEFLEFAADIVAGRSGPVLWRAPGYQGFLAAGLFLGGGKTVLVRLLQVALSGAACFLTYRVGRRLWGEPAGLAAGGFLAFYPSHVALSHLLWSETLYGFLILLALDRLLAAGEGGPHGAILLAGAALGAAALTRSTAVLLIPVSALWLVSARPAGRRWRAAGLLLLAGLGLILPWSLWASSRAGRPVIIDTNAGFNLWSGNNRYIPGDLQGIWSVGHLQHNGLDPDLAEFLPDDLWRAETPWRQRRDGVVDPHGPDGEAWYRARAVETIASDPAGFLARVPHRLAAFWAPDFFLPRHLVRDWYGATPPWLALLLVAVTWAAAAVPLIGGPAALAVLPRSRFRSLAWLWGGTYLAVVAVAYGHSRMHQPLVPLLVLAVAGGLFSGAARRFRRRSAVFALAPLAAWVLALPAVGGVYLAPGPRHASTARLLGAARHLPLPGSRRLAWMLASVEASAGRKGAAGRILSEPRFARDPWSLYLRARITASGSEQEQLLTQAVSADPELFPAWYALGLARIRAGDRAGALEALYRAGKLRPWDPRVERARAGMR